MKNLSKLLYACIFSIGAVACHSTHNNNQHRLSAIDFPPDSFSHFIPIDTANKMLLSYLNSIDWVHNDTELQSLIVDVHQLRRYIDSLPNSGDISHIKLMFAHTLSYANSDRANTRAGYNSNGLTIIIAAYQTNGNYVYYPVNRVLDYTQPCPPICPPGMAASPLLPH